MKLEDRVNALTEFRDIKSPERENDLHEQLRSYEAEVEELTEKWERDQKSQVELQKIAREAHTELKSLREQNNQLSTEKDDLETRLAAQPAVGSPSGSDMPKVHAAETRENDLWDVFRWFDLDNSGKIESSELMELGQTRRSLGQVKGVWDKASNDHLVAQLGGDSNGRVNGESFVQFFTSELRKTTDAEFDATIRQFKTAAQACRSKRDEEMQIEMRSLSATVTEVCSGLCRFQFECVMIL